MNDRNARRLLVLLSFFGVVISYTDRVNVSVAAVAMKESLGWSQTEKGLVLSSFFVGYMLFMFPAGWLTTRIGGKRVLGFSVLAWSILTLLTPWAAGTSFRVLLAARVGMGLAEAGTFPAIYGLFGRWIPESERARAVARMLSGVPLGTVVGLAVTGAILARARWSWAFTSFGLVGLLWSALWFAKIEDEPRDASMTTLAGANRGAVPWARLMLNAPALGIVFAHFATTWSLYVLLSWLPSYFRDAHGLDLSNVGLFSAAPWLAMAAVTNLGAWASDRWLARGVSVTRVRKVMQSGGLAASAIFLIATRSVSTPGPALVLVCLATGALGLSWCGYAPGILDVSPRYGALLGGISNTIATIPGIVGVGAVGWLVDATGTYSSAFVMTAIVSAIGALAFGVFFDGRPVLAEERVER